MHRHFVIYKPYGFHSQFILVNNKKKKLLGELYDFPEKTMAIGRLDKDSEGLLFLTTNGKTSEQVRSQKVEKEYYVQVDGLITDEAIDQLKSGVKIIHRSESYQTKPCKAKHLETPNLPPRGKKIRDERHGPTSWLSITLREGKFRQVRKMTAAVGFPTLRLLRYRIGDTELGNMKPGDVLEKDSLVGGIKVSV